jgi:hypothetical protein
VELGSPPAAACQALPQLTSAFLHTCSPRGTTARSTCLRFDKSAQDVDDNLPFVLLRKRSQKRSKLSDVHFIHALNRVNASSKVIVAAVGLVAGDPIRSLQIVLRIESCRRNRRLPLPILPAGLNIERSWRNGRLYRLPYWPIADRTDRIC